MEKPLVTCQEEQRKKARGHRSQLVLMCYTQWSKKSQIPPKQVKMHIGEALLWCLAETFGPENQPPLFNSGGIQPNLIFHHENCVLSASRRYFGHLPRLYMETFTSFWCARSHLKHGVETKPYFPSLRFTAISPPLGGH